MNPIYVAVVGAGEADEEIARLAEEVGQRLAQAGALVVCGGLGGVMEAACRGAKSAGGTTIGILPGSDRSGCNAFLDVAIPTGMGETRNALIVRAADVVIAVGGEYGTLSEIAFALKTGTPVVGIRAWELVRDGETVEAFERATSADEAVDKALSLAR
ncbi:MAG: TIGR00725 family protein [Actinomycetota bacterium]